MKFKLVQNPYGREMGFKQDIVWFIQGTDDNKTWNNYVWRNSPSIVYEKEVYHRPPMSAYLTIVCPRKIPPFRVVVQADI